MRTRTTSRDATALAAKFRCWTAIPLVRATQISFTEKPWISAISARRRSVGNCPQVGTPCIWGGETPGVGFDCSGLVQAAYEVATGFGSHDVTSD
jgi:hypothetical protein